MPQISSDYSNFGTVIESYKARIVEKDNEIEQLIDKQSDIQTRLATAKKNLDATLTELEQARKERAEANSHLDELRDRIQSLEARAKSNKKKCEDDLRTTAQVR